MKNIKKNKNSTIAQTVIYYFYYMFNSDCFAHQWKNRDHNLLAANMIAKISSDDLKEPTPQIKIFD